MQDINSLVFDPKACKNSELEVFNFILSDSDVFELNSTYKPPHLLIKNKNKYMFICLHNIKL